MEVTCLHSPAVAVGGFVAAGHGRCLTGMTLYITSKTVNFVRQKAGLTGP